MNSRARLRNFLDQASACLADGAFDAARDWLDLAEADPERGLLGPPTALGLPRKLHSLRLKLAKARGDRVTRAGLQMHLGPPPDLLADLFRADASGRQLRLAAVAAPVPRLLHQVWIGGPPPVTTGHWRAHAAAHGWGYRLWDETALQALGITADPAYREMRARGDLPGAVDVARYHILLREGGVYLDCDWYPAGPSLETALPLAGLSAMAEPVPRLTGRDGLLLANSLIAAPPGHPAIAALVAALPEALRRCPEGPAWWTTGPLVFTLACREGPMTLLEASLVGGAAPPRAEAAELARMAEAAAAGGGLLIGWKPWQAG